MFNTLKKIIISNQRNIIIRKLHDRKLPEIKYNKNKLPKKTKYIGIDSPKKSDYYKNTLNKKNKNIK